MPTEEQLEQLIVDDPGILGTPLMIIGRQAATPFGTIADLLAVDADGGLHVLELKRNKTPREVVAQALDYGSWAAGLGHDDIVRMFEGYRSGEVFDTAFSEAFESGPPDELNREHYLTVVAAEVDAATERIITYLNGRFAVPINVVFFRYYQDRDRAFLARTWLLDEAAAASGGEVRKPRNATREQWNGTDWFVSFGESAGGRSWEDARRFGFVSAGGGEWYSKTIRRLPVGGRIFVSIPGSGYVGVGVVTAEARPFEEAVVEMEGHPRPLAGLEAQLAGRYRPLSKEGVDTAEYVVPVRWERPTLPRSEAVWERGMFANQNSACPLRNRFTLERLAKVFHLDEPGDQAAAPTETPDLAGAPAPLRSD